MSVVDSMLLVVWQLLWLGRTSFEEACRFSSLCARNAHYNWLFNSQAFGSDRKHTCKIPHDQCDSVHW